ncbi:MAG TPA: MBL fold metallo-hydrolase [Actinophytocola sp.]|jgi:glyoxylase-like metal-dependent hydrolase (beta-lactamase superfamily II)|uniref:MBL fold metallo-hydrolase n=1 Tax=Actinophytocola sp. TaxID=1872138 RepID=UPI002F932623
METVPGPAEVAGGVWSVALPFPNPLGFAFSYVLPVAGGVLVVDAGWDSAECWDAFRAGLAAAGAGLDDVVGVVVTHIHPDHYGLAERIRAASPAWIAVHPAERPRIAANRHDRERAIADLAEWLRQAGAPPSEFAELAADEEDIKARISTVVPERDLVDGQAVPGTDGALVAVHTPGHTPGHLCFHDRQRGLLFTGDHILPRVTPNISKRPQSDVDPLRDFMASVRKVRAFGDVTVLPGHERAFTGLWDRLDVLAAHHDERLTEIVAAVGAGAGTVWEVACAVRWSRPFERLQGRARRSAIGETFSHLYRLAVEGRVRWEPGRPDRWLPAREHVA